jgi:hypothetical protein
MQGATWWAVRAPRVVVGSALLSIALGCSAELQRSDVQRTGDDQPRLEARSAGQGDGSAGAADAAGPARDATVPRLMDGRVGADLQGPADSALGRRDASMAPDAGSPGVATLRHGAELTRSMVGPAGLGISTGQLRRTAVRGERVSTWPTDGLPSWIPAAPYVYNNDPNNHGGVVPAGGLRIDGFAVPAGTWVAQFDDFANESIIIAGDNGGTTAQLPGIVFRGCRWRGAVTAPGYLNVYSASHTTIWLLYSEAGGLGPADQQYNEIPFKLADASSESFYYRNYLSYTTTAIQPGSRGPQIIENYIEKITLYYDDRPPPGETTGKHLNGISLNGGQTHALILRNKVLLQSPDDAGRSIGQTDCIAFFQDDGALPGTGKNSDGSAGYQVRDNFVGGGGYSFYAGMNPGQGPASVQRMVLVGNQVTNQWWPQGGSYGPLAAEPVWGAYGNLKSGNTFAETGVPW